MAPADTSSDLEPIFISVKKAAEMIGVKPWTFWNQILNDPDCTIDTRYFGRRRLVVLQSLREYAANLPTERQEPVA